MIEKQTQFILGVIVLVLNLESLDVVTKQCEKHKKTSREKKKNNKTKASETRINEINSTWGIE